MATSEDQEGSSEVQRTATESTDGTGLEQVTYDGIFDAFPMFSPDGKKLIFSSNRNNNGTHDTNLFVADWVN